MAFEQIEVNELRLEHEGGTKFYKVSLIVGPDRQQSVLIKRWGKLSAHGEYKIEKHASRERGQEAYYEAIRAKQKRGYANDSDHETTRVTGKSLASARAWLKDELKSPIGAGDIMDFITGSAALGEIIEVIFEEPEKPKAPDRTGDENWASW